MSRVLQVLQRDGPLSAAAVATRLGVNRTTVARHLRTLGRSGLVTRRLVRHGVGRPRHVYDVTPEGQASLPGGYERYAVGFLAAAREVGGDDLLARILEAHRRAEVASARARLDDDGLDGAPLIDRIRGLAELLDELGYLAEVSDERGLRLILNGCPILRLAKRSPTVCESELRLVGQALGGLVERETTIAAGARACVYRIWAREQSFPATVWTSSQMLAGRHDDETTETAPGTHWSGEQMIGRRSETS